MCPRRASSSAITTILCVCTAMMIFKRNVRSFTVLGSLLHTLLISSYNTLTTAEPALEPAKSQQFISGPPHGLPTSDPCILYPPASSPKSNSFSTAIAARSLDPQLVTIKSRTAVVTPRDKKSTLAYVFYATNDKYACSILVNVHRMQNLYHIKYGIVALVSEGVSAAYRKELERLNVQVILQEPPQISTGSNGYYGGCLLKLVSFWLHRLNPVLKRVVVLDSDQLVLRNLDFLFDLPSVDLVAPRAYWLDRGKIASTLLVISLSDRVADEVQEAIRTIGPRVYDMEIVNQLFFRTVLLLPGSFVTLNSHWEAWDLPDWFRPEEAAADSVGAAYKIQPTTTPATSSPVPSEHPLAAELFDLYRYGTVVLHFTAVGKPWEYTVEQARGQRGELHPVFWEQWAAWRTEAKAICPAIKRMRWVGEGPDRVRKEVEVQLVVEI